ncbi:MAG: hypothetical protein AVDCRST_MAG89-273, partial [uncultured Gemmatimonadetes bacterium]
ALRSTLSRLAHAPESHRIPVRPRVHRRRPGHFAPAFGDGKARRRAAAGEHVRPHADGRAAGVPGARAVLVGKPGVRRGGGGELLCVPGLPGGPGASVPAVGAGAPRLRPGGRAVAAGALRGEPPVVLRHHPGAAADQRPSQRAGARRPRVHRRAPFRTRLRGAGAQRDSRAQPALPRRAERPHAGAVRIHDAADGPAAGV